MADQQDFEIKIRVNADTSQVETIRQSFQKLGAQVQVTNLQAAQAAAASASAGAGNAAELGRIVGQFTGIGIGAAIYTMVSGLKEASAEIIKVAGELDKQGDMLVKHAQLYGEQARHAKDTDDVLKISSATLKDIETTQKTVNELSQKELGYAASFSDYLQKQLLARQRAAGMGDYEAARAAELETAQDQAISARKRGMQEVLAAEQALNKTAEERLAIINREIAAEEKRKQAAAANNDPGGYVKSANNLAALKKDQAEAQKATDQHRQAVQKDFDAASPQAKAIITNEDRAARLRASGDQRVQQDAAAYEKTADALKKGALPSQLDEVERLKKEREGLSPPPSDRPTAQPSGEAAVGGSSYQDFSNALKNMEQSMKQTKEEMATLRKEMIGIWR